ncbi:MAG: GNAT family N-acetyltransferase [archaeon]
MEELKIKLVEKMEDLRELFYLGGICHNSREMVVDSYGEHSAVAWSYNEPIGFWHGEKREFNLPIDFGVRHTCFWSKGIFVLSDFRRKGTGILIKEHQLKFAKDKGYRSSCCKVYPDNNDSLNIQRKLGAEVRLGDDGLWECCFDLGDLNL